MENRNRMLSFIAAMLIIIGNLMPWQCFSGFLNGCTQGLDISRMMAMLGVEINPMRGLSLFSSNEHFVILAVIIFLVALLLNTGGLNTKKILLVMTGLFYLGIVFILILSIVHNGFYLGALLDFLTVLLSALTTWLVFYCGIFNGKTSHKILMVSSLALSLTVIVYISQVLFNQFFTRMDTKEKLQIGLPFILLGSMIIVILRTQYNPVEDRSVDISIA